MSEKNEKLTKKELRKFSLRYAITAQASQSYEAMQGLPASIRWGHSLKNGSLMIRS